ncbi:MAG: protein kinase [Clostridia bacterium]|nr:protein kinase [Clostridia bacterium]
MEIFHGYELIGDWKNSTSGKIAIGQRGGKKYFIKQYQTPVMPLKNGALDAKTFAKNKEKFEAFVNLRTKTNKTIRPLTGEGGNIIIPVEEFVEGNHFVEVSSLIDGIVDDEDVPSVLESLTYDTKLLLMMTAAGALSSVHGKGLIHSDLKLKNILLVKNSTGHYVAKLVDFDSSYFEGDAPDEIIGTIDYYSPELGGYGAYDDPEEAKAYGDTLTTKSDIFSLGLIFHKYLTGEMPTPVNLTDKLKKRAEKGKIIYSWVALKNGCSLELSPLIKNPLLVSLISDMLSVKPEDRPTAIEVLKVLQSIPKGEKGGDITVSWDDPYPEHNITWITSKIEADKVVLIKKSTAASKKVYQVMIKGGSKISYSMEDMIAKGYARVNVCGWCDFWPEHSSSWNEAKLERRGYVASEKKESGGIKGYSLFRSDYSATFFTLDKLRMMGLAIKGGSSSESDKAKDKDKVKDTDKVPKGPEDFTPWPEDSIVFDTESMEKKKIKSICRGELDGVKGYYLVREDGKKQFTRKQMLIMQKLAKTK